VKRIELAGLTTRVVGDDKAPVTVVLLHGFGAPGDDLVALADYIRAPARFVFPEAPLELGGLYGDSRAWWLLDLAKLEEDLQAGKPRDRRSEVPDGLVPAREQVSNLLDQVVSRLGADPQHLVLGGFSQGAMLSLDVALHRDTPPAGLILMSGTLLAESEWAPRFPKLAGVPVLQSHGRADALLPFSIATALRDRLKAAGAAVDWHEFLGGHEIPPHVLDALATFIKQR
jgi:phospholipase/carboxylesterase